MINQAYPLRWPLGWKRTSMNQRAANNNWKGTTDKYRRELLDELRRLGATDIVISTNVPLRKDGEFYADFRTPDDPGVAIYFKRGGKAFSLACDKYTRITWNVHAIGLTIEAMRQIERCGASDMLDRAFTGFAALPESTEKSWRNVLGFAPGEFPSMDHVERLYRERARQAHPDRGGSDAAMQELNRARDAARAELSAEVSA